ncbi:hypothetical protein GQ44DRAFT_726790 [Phaeosphaeriaceae sp. PMI808]|nr:hypothetical protein GQ44DRAFT_726790 [Phaeosphaeriaceae sp. PMI808]
MCNTSTLAATYNFLKDIVANQLVDRCTPYDFKVEISYMVRIFFKKAPPLSRMSTSSSDEYTRGHTTIYSGLEIYYSTTENPYYLPGHMESIPGNPVIKQANSGESGTQTVMTLQEIFAIPIPEETEMLSTPPPPTNKRDFITLHLQDIPATFVETDDFAMAWELVHSAIIPDPYPHYTWTDTKSLANWLFTVLAIKLNALMEVEARMSGSRHGQIKNLRGKSRERIQDLAKWCRTGRTKQVKFRAHGDWINRLEAFDYAQDLKISDLIVLITEVFRRTLEHWPTHMPVDEEGANAGSSLQDNMAEHHANPKGGADEDIDLDSYDPQVVYSEDDNEKSRIASDPSVGFTAKFGDLKNPKFSNVDITSLENQIARPPSPIPNLDMDQAELVPDPNINRVKLWLREEAGMDSDLPRFRDLNTPSADDYSQLARCIRFSKCIAQKDINWVINDFCVTEMVKRTNWYGVELLRSRTNIYIPEFGDLRDSLSEFMVVLAIRFAHCHPEKDYTAAYIRIIFDQLDLECNTGLLLGLLTMEDKVRFIKHVKRYEVRYMSSMAEN